MFVFSELHQWKDLRKLCKVCHMKQDGCDLISVASICLYLPLLNLCICAFLINVVRLVPYHLISPAGSSPSAAAWKVLYYQWVMQLFEQYNASEAACKFALAALEQVDEALSNTDGSSREILGETDTTVKGRLWANVFKFTLDINNYHDAYCAIISNPDEESKNICLRRFIIVLYERGAVKVCVAILTVPPNLYYSQSISIFPCISALLLSQPFDIRVEECNRSDKYYTKFRTSS